MHEFATRIADVVILREDPFDRERVHRRIDVAAKSMGCTSSDEWTDAPRGFTTEPTYYRRQRLSRVISCLAGELFVALVDVRHDSPTFLQWQTLMLSEEDARFLEIPGGVACGWQVLSEWARVYSLASTVPDVHDERRLRWNDFSLQLPWPEIPEEVAEHPRPSLSLGSLRANQLPRRRCKPQVASRAKLKTRRPSRSTAPLVSLHQPTPASTACTTTVTPVEAFAQANSPTETAHSSPRTTSKRRSPIEPDSPTILLLGCNGQLGGDLHRALRTLGTVICGCREPRKYRSMPVPVQVDVTRPASVRQAMRSVRPTLVVNATGLSDVAHGEQTPRLAQALNANAPQVIAEEAERLQCGLIHFCTSQVFSGDGKIPWTERSPTEPLNQIGRTKLIGTEAILASGIPHLVLRSSWLYSARNRNFVTECVDQLGYRNYVTMAGDHLGTPTPTRWLAELLGRLLAQAISGGLTAWLQQHGGLYHVAPLGHASRVGVCDQIMATCQSLGLPVVASEVRSQPLRELNPGLPIPLNQQLSAGKFAMRFGIELPRWQELLNQELAVYLGQADCVQTHVA
jgi:dTDP-4-dehydrorhamnose reductase